MRHSRDGCEACSRVYMWEPYIDIHHRFGFGLASALRAIALSIRAIQGNPKTMHCIRVNLLQGLMQPRSLPGCFDILSSLLAVQSI